MIAIAVDDEALMLGALAKAISASPDITAVTKFSDCEDAIGYVKNNPVDIAFLDINMRGMGGIALAEKIPEMKSTLELPWTLAAAVCGCIVCYYLLVSVLPLGRLLRCPPASLAAKYDL